MEQTVWHSIRMLLPDDQDPPAVRWEGKVSKIQVLEVWVETGRWWQGEERCTCYRLLTEDAKVLEVCRGQATGEWTLLRWID